VKKTISIVTDGLEFNGNSLNEISLGGSESAVIYIANELSKIDNNEVTVYCKCNKPGIYNNVDYRSNKDFTNDNKSQMDVCIVSRFTNFLSLNIDSKLNILWIHDIDVEEMELSLGKIDKIFCLSEFQKKLYQEKYSIDNDVFYLTTNGFDPNLVLDTILYKDKQNNYVYASRPERGLLKLLTDIWPKILEKEPKSTLHLCGYLNTNIPKDHPVFEYYQKVQDILLTSKNIINHGSLLKPTFYKLLNKCKYMIYPTDFPEISCINAIEAQANGCLVITTDKFALSETVKSNTKIKFSDTYNQNFLELLEYYKDQKYDEEVDFAKKLIEKDYSWNTIANEWNEAIDSLFICRSIRYKNEIYNRLEYNSDLVALKELESSNEKYSKLVEFAEYCNIYKTEYIPSRGINNTRVQAVIDLIKKDAGCLNYQLDILELGCNDGIIIQNVIQQLDLYVDNTYALDSNTDALQTLKNDCPNINIINDNVLNISKYNNLDVNVIILGEILEHIEDTIGFLNNLMSIVKSRTLFIFTTPFGPWEAMIKDNLLKHHVHHFELSDIKEIFKDVELKIVKNLTNSYGRKGEYCSHWIYSFIVESNEIPIFYKPNYIDKFVKTRPYKSISASLIVKNEEDNLSRCLKSINNIVDEIIIVDTGSTDTTKEIASRFTDKIYDLEWEEEDGLGNFARARNHSLSKCSGDYILWMDADEELINAINLMQFITSDYYDSILIKQRSCVVIGDDISKHDDSHHDRLFKNKKGIEFTGVVHEYPCFENKDWIKKGLFQDISFIAHYGTINKYQRHERITNKYLDLIIKNYNTFPNRLIAQYYYFGLLCTKLIESGKLTDLQVIFDFWFNIFIESKDLWILKKCFPFIQDAYKSLYINKVDLKDKIIEVREFENKDNERVRLFATSNNEFNIFLDVISQVEIGSHR
jgi:glycosyltransferase involved in cell wall biosynthesis/2-polyprenyl-3-methyl-5-hydroxy-6-metoxy-1,4-benzoquinol methylase